MAAMNNNNQQKKKKNNNNNKLLLLTTTKKQQQRQLQISPGRLQRRRFFSRLSSASWGEGPAARDSIACWIAVVDVVLGLLLVLLLLLDCCCCWIVVVGSSNAIARDNIAVVVGLLLLDC